MMTMTDTKLTVEKDRNCWNLVAPMGGVVKSGYKRKVDAEADLAVAWGLVAAIREAVSVKYTYLDYSVFDAASDLRRLRQDLSHALRKQARQMAEDADRVDAGGTPWYSEGQQTRSAVELDLITAAYKAAAEKYKMLCSVVRHDARTSQAAIALAVTAFLTRRAG